MILGGEEVSAGLWAQLRAAGLPCRVMYGPTEVTVDSMMTNPQESVTPNLGRPVKKTTAVVMDLWDCPAPDEVVGELCLGGLAVSLGYLNDPRLTAERFVPDPFPAAPGARLYRTGDRASRTGRHPLDFFLFHGRNDREAKIRGFRVSCAEVERSLSMHPTVRRAVVVADGSAYDRRLAAFVVLEANVEPNRAAERSIRTQLGEELPSYMVPSRLVIVDEIPLTAYGKIDYPVLLDSQQQPSMPSHDDRAGPATEQLILGLWTELLDRADIRVDDDFFDLGGHSLLAMEVSFRLSESLEIDVPVRLLFAHRTIHDLAAVLDETRTTDGNPVHEVAP